MSNPKNLEVGKGYKDEGDALFKKTEYRPALGKYYLALTHLEGLDKNAMSSMGMSAPSNAEGEDKPINEIDELISKVYGNMSACHMSLKNYQRVIETADKALKKNPKNFKVMLRKARAVGEQGWHERSKRLLEEIKTKSPEDAAKADAEIARLNSIDQAKDKKYAQKQRGFLKRNVDLGIEQKVEPEEEGVEEISTPGVKAA
ncbi:hypothetical protein CYLTODRAFT_373268 [Cylindrobasidium torrendii FP15055 ss-10]|uniref:Uncharacterized protein n=1 Tax=Cylindrobasidium torrendii FP15055 ss-10 TaxID=1314674 RepID=A0A0D7BEZ8_9AGAR|nr:hypothetical protein CYLTODRAFT_373268 [Cylindrobasidium torrendii FP15055 ss-10]